MIVRKVVSNSVRVVGVVVSRVVSSHTYVIRKFTKHTISEYKHKNFYLTKYHITKEYFPFYSQDKRLSYRLIDNS